MRFGRTELETYLLERRSGGSFDSSGMFTLNQDKLLAKLAKHQLPFEEAWALKVVQSIVAGGNTSPLKIELGAKSTSFYFSNFGFELEELATGLLNPTQPSNRSLSHMLVGLWAVISLEHWGFQLAFPHSNKALVWNGDSFEQIATSKVKETACLTVALIPKKASSSGSMQRQDLARRNQNLFSALKTYCFVCPPPLSVDGKRLDTLLNYCGHELYDGAFPLMVKTALAPLEELIVPQSTFSSSLAKVKKNTQKYADFSFISHKLIADQEPFSRSSLAYVVSLNIADINSKSSSDGNLLPGELWRKALRPSLIYWVIDGVSFEHTQLFAQPTHCSLGCFVSAKDLLTDLTTTKLIPNDALNERIGLVKKAMVTAIPDIRALKLEKVQSKVNESMFNSTLVSLGIAAVFFLVAPELWLLSSPFILGGSYISTIASYSTPSSTDYSSKVKKSIDILCNQISEEQSGFAR